MLSRRVTANVTVMSWHCHCDVLIVTMTSCRITVTQLDMSSLRHDIVTVTCKLSLWHHMTFHCDIPWHHSEATKPVFSYLGAKFIEITFNTSNHIYSMDLWLTLSHTLFAISLFLFRDNPAFLFLSLAVRFSCRLCSASATVLILGLGLG